MKKPEETDRPRYPGNLDVEVAVDGRVYIRKRLTSLNTYLNQHTNDPRLRGVSVEPRYDQPTALIAALSIVEFPDDLPEIATMVRDAGFHIIDQIECSIPGEISQVLATESRQVDLLIVRFHPSDGKMQCLRLQRELADQIDIQCVITVGIPGMPALGANWLFGGIRPGQRLQRILQRAFPYLQKGILLEALEKGEVIFQ